MTHRRVLFACMATSMLLLSVSPADAQSCRAQARGHNLTAEEADNLCGDDSKGWPVRCYEQTKPGSLAPLTREKSLQFCAKLTGLWPVRCVEKIHARWSSNPHRVADFCRSSKNLWPANCVVEALDDHLGIDKAFEQCKPAEGGAHR